MNPFKIGDRVCIPSSFNATGTIKNFSSGLGKFVTVVLDGFGIDSIFTIAEIKPLNELKWNREYNVLPTEDFYGEPKCECGSLTCGSPKHSIWCKLFKEDL